MAELELVNWALLLKIQLHERLFMRYSGKMYTYLDPCQGKCGEIRDYEEKVSHRTCNIWWWRMVLSWFVVIGTKETAMKIYMK